MLHTRALAPRPLLVAAALIAACSGGNNTTATDASATDTTTTSDTTDSTSMMTTTLTTTVTTTLTTTDTTGPTTTMTTGPTTTDTDPTTTMTTSPTTSETDPTTTEGTTTEGTTTDTTEGTTEPPVTCDDLMLNGDETDVDCGGSCLPCADGLACMAGPDCESKVCADMICAAPTCEDEAQNGLETDVDCGGGECSTCVTGQMCAEGSDCKSQLCNGGVCIDSACDDQQKNGMETDVDCGGGECTGCADGLVCMLADDCQSGVCTDSACAVPACDDMVQNGDELGVDCGGSCMPCPLPILNEVDYDIIGTDNAEFIEIYNPNAAPVNLKGLEVILVNGSNNMVYAIIDLSPGGILPPMGYLVIAPANFPALPPEVIKIEFNGQNDQVQNGAPDGIALVNTQAKLLIDALSYEGSITMAQLSFDTVSLVEGTPLPANIADSNTLIGTLSRLPNGSDTDDAATDWNFTSTPTPGLANVP